MGRIRLALSTLRFKLSTLNWTHAHTHLQISTCHPTPPQADNCLAFVILDYPSIHPQYQQPTLCHRLSYQRTQL